MMFNSVTIMLREKTNKKNLNDNTFCQRTQSHFTKDSKTFKRLITNTLKIKT